ncbi:MAG: hypothetical protein AAGF12_23305, partial [Myxococcota bacterium]
MAQLGRLNLCRALLVGGYALVAGGGVLSSGGCSLAADDDEDPRRVPMDSLDCTSDDAAWFVECPADREVGPAELILATVHRMDLEVPDVYLWLEGSETPVQLAGVGALPASMDANEARHAITFALPTFEEGVHRIAFGSATEPRSNWVPFRLRFPELRYSQQEVAALIDEGVVHLADDVQAVWDLPEPTWQAIVDESYDSEQRAIVEGEFELARESARLAAEQFRALSPDDARVLQAAFESSGVLQSIEQVEAGSTHYPERVPLIHDTGLNSAHRVAIQLDAISTGIDLLGLTLDAISVVALLSGVGAPVAAVSTGVRVSVAVIKGLIDTFVPTDLVEVDVQLDTTQYMPNPVRMVPWGTFRPQNGLGGGLRSIGDVIAELLSSILPGGKGRVAEQAVNFLNSVIIRLGFSATYWDDRLDAMRFETLAFKAPIDMNAYNVSLGAALMRTPIIGPKLVEALWFLNSISIRDAVRLQSGVPAAYFEDADIELFNWDLLRVNDVRFPSNDVVDQGAAVFEMNAWALETRSVAIVSLPKLRWVSVVPEALRVQNFLDEDDPNDGQTDHVFYTHTEGERPAVGLAVITPNTPR